MPAHAHVALRSPEPPGDFRGSERLRVGEGEDLAVLLAELLERPADLRAPLLRQERAEGVVRAAFGRRGSEAPESLDLTAGRPVPALANVKGGLEEERGKRGRLLHTAGLQGLDRAANGLLGHVFGVGEIPDPAGGEIYEAFPKCLDVLNRAVGGAGSPVGWTFARLVPHFGYVNGTPARGPRAARRKKSRNGNGLQGTGPMSPSDNGVRRFAAGGSDTQEDTMRIALPSPIRRGVAAAFVLGAAVAAGPLFAEHVWTSRGPADVAWVRDVAIADGTAYAGTLNGVFRSVDRGATWQSAALAGQWIDQVVGRSGASAVYARAAGELHATRDGGATWSLVLSDVNSAAVHPVEASTVYAGLVDGVILKSADSGSSWNVVSREFAGQFIVTIAFDAQAMYVHYYDGLFRSADGGVSWTFARPPSTDFIGTVFGGAAALYVQGGSGGFCRTLDSAQTWSCNPNVYFSRLVEIPDGVPGAAPRLMGAAHQGLLESRDSGATWAPVVVGDPGSAAAIQGLAADVTSSLIVAGSDRRTYRSHDLGASWAPANSGLRSTWIRALALDPSNPSNLWAGALGNGVVGPGLFHSMDAGLSWSPAGVGSPLTVDIVTIDPADSSRILAGNAEGVFQSNDGGATWSSSRPGRYGLYSLAIDPESTERVFAGTGEGLMWSHDGGRSWLRTTATQAVYSLLFDQKRPGTLYAGSYYDLDSSYYSYPEGGSIFISYDRGANFTKSEDLGDQVSALAQDPFHEDVLFAGTAAGVSSSADGGMHWQRTSSGLPGTYVSALVADPMRPGHLYAATERGVFRTVDGAHSWEPFSAGLTSTNASTLAISPDGSRLHAGTAGGGIYDVDLRDAPAFPCVASATRLCLVGNRYALDLVAARKGEARYQPGAAHPLNDRAGYFGLPSATGDPDLPEIIVKMLGEGAFGYPGAAVFYTSLTTLPYGLTVTDTVTGEQQVYSSRRGSPMCGSADRAFEELGTLGPRQAAAAETSTALEMLGGRFSVTLEASHPRTHQAVPGQATPLTDRSGYFGIAGVTGDPQFPEVVVKMVDGRGINGDFWFFHSGLTSLDYTLTVTDQVTHVVRTYESPGAFCGSADINLSANP